MLVILCNIIKNVAELEEYHVMSCLPTLNYERSESDDVPHLAVFHSQQEATSANLTLL
jgi:hypothetical protein